MKITHEICVDHDGSVPGASAALTEKVLLALGHGPGCKFKADHPEDTIHGRIISMAICDTRTLGKDILQFADGRYETASAENIDAWWQEQGHRLMKIEGDKALGNTIIHLQVTGEDEDAMPNSVQDGKLVPGRKTTLRRPEHFPTAEGLCSSLDAIK